MKRILNVIVLLLSCVSIMKAEQLVATLQSGDATKAFYGYSALKEAYEEATDGDVITLSKGNFEGVTIEKSITLRGAGAFVVGHSTTISDLTVNADYAIVEGIYITNLLSLKGNNQQVLRCWIKTLNSNYYADWEVHSNDYSEQPATFYAFIADCAIRNDGHAFDCVDAIYKNCTIYAQANKSYRDGYATYDHCIVRIKGDSNCDMHRYGCFYNCILNHSSNTDITICTPNQFYNTVIYSHHPIKFYTGVQRDNCLLKQISYTEYDNIFDESKFPYFFFEEVPATDVNSAFVCGVVDHKKWPAIPRVIESNIDKETDSAGHLKVEVKVSCER